ncbi:hypothetical protein ACTXT7_007287 [Hymenolepis weldensis]
MEKPMQEMVDGCVRADPTEVPTVMHVHEVSSNTDAIRCCYFDKEYFMTPQFFPQGLTVNTHADVYVETLQTITVKPPWIDSVANGRPSLQTKFGFIP